MDWTWLVAAHLLVSCISISPMKNLSNRFPFTVLNTFVICATKALLPAVFMRCFVCTMARNQLPMSATNQIACESRGMACLSATAGNGFVSGAGCHIGPFEMSNFLRFGIDLKNGKGKNKNVVFEPFVWIFGSMLYMCGWQTGAVRCFGKLSLSKDHRKRRSFTKLKFHKHCSSEVA